VNLLLLAPVSLALLGIGAGWFVPRYLKPKPATQLLTAAIVVTTIAIVSALVQVAAAGASEIPAVADVLGWCRAIYHGQHGAAPIVGLAAAGGLAFIVVGSWRHHRRIHRELAVFAEVDGVEVVDLEGPVAFAVPGDPGGVVLGAGLLAQLDGEERCAVLAHENAHLALHHHRYVHAAELCAAGLPVLRPLASQVRFMTERWADEVAAEMIGSRQVLATTIARVALMPPGVLTTAPLSFRGDGTVDRVDALLNPRRSPFLAAASSALAVVAAVAVGSAIQLHHLVAFVAHICPL
jgi:Zn-dependent protease with chaperone function